MCGARAASRSCNLDLYQNKNLLQVNVRYEIKCFQDSTSILKTGSIRSYINLVVPDIYMDAHGAESDLEGKILQILRTCCMKNVRP